LGRSCFLPRQIGFIFDWGTTKLHPQLYYFSINYNPPNFIRMNFSRASTYNILTTTSIQKSYSKNLFQHFLNLLKCYYYCLSQQQRFLPALQH